jgi:hypothetical protein
MTARTKKPHGRPAQRRRAQAPPVRQVERVVRLGWGETPAQLKLAIGLSVLGAVLIAAGPPLGLLVGQPPAGFDGIPLQVLLGVLAVVALVGLVLSGRSLVLSGRGLVGAGVLIVVGLLAALLDVPGTVPLLPVLAVVPPLLAIGFVLFGRALTGAAVLAGAALLAPGRALADLQFVHDVPLASRPELLVQTSLAELTPAVGLWVLLGGHVVTALAGALAVGKAGAAPESTYATEVEGGEDLVARTRIDEPADDPAKPATGRRGPLGWTLFLGGISVIGLLMAPFGSDNAYLLAHSVADSPLLALLGSLAVVAGLVFGCVYAGTAARPEVTRGTVLGLLTAVAAVAVPGIASGLSVPGLHPALGPYLALAPVALLAVVVFALPSLRPAALTSGTTTSAEVEVTFGAQGMHVATGIVGVLAGVAAFVAANAAQLVLDPELTELLASEGATPPETFANRQLVPVAFLLVVLGGALIVPSVARVVRPAFVVALGSVAMVSAGALDAALTASDASDEVRLGAGFWFVIAALVLAAVAAICATIAGGAERDEVDLSEEIGTAADPKMLVPCVAAALLAVGAFGLPMIDAVDFTAPGIWTDFRPASWGLLAAVAVVAAASLVALRARPVRAVALLLGAVTVVGVHLLELPLTGARATEPAPGLGTWLSVACVVALLAGAASALITALTSREKAS